MEKINILNYGEFSTEVLLTSEVREFFKNNNELTTLNDFDSDEWYQGWLLKYLDKEKDGKPDEVFGKKFQLIYTNIIQNPEDYQDTEDILQELRIPIEKLIFDGSKTIFENKPEDIEKTKFWVRWVVVRE